MAKSFQEIMAERSEKANDANNLTKTRSFSDIVAERGYQARTGPSVEQIANDPIYTTFIRPEPDAITGAAPMPRRTVSPTQTMSVVQTETRTTNQATDTSVFARATQNPSLFAQPGFDFKGYSQYFDSLPKNESLELMKNSLSPEEVAYKYNPQAYGELVSQNFNKSGLIGQIGSGVYRGLMSVGDAVRGIGNTISGVFGGNKDAFPGDPGWDAVKEARAKEMENKSFGQNLPENLSYVLSAMAPALATGGATGIGLTGLQAGGLNAQQALDEGATPNQALVHGGITGTAEAAVERYLGFIPGFDSSALKALTQGGADNIKKIAKDYVVKSAQEGVEEVIMDPVTGISKKYTYKPDMNWGGVDFKGSIKPTNWELVKGGVFDIPQMAESGALGFLAGGVLGGAQLPGQVSQARAAQQALTQDLPQALIAAQSFPQNTQTYQIASNIISRNNSGVMPTIEDYISLAETMNTDALNLYTQAQNQNPIQSDKMTVLTNLGSNKKFSIKNDNGLLNRSENLQNLVNQQQVLENQAQNEQNQQQRMSFSIKNGADLIRRAQEDKSVTESQTILPDEIQGITNENTSTNLIDAAKKYALRKMEADKRFTYKKNQNENDINQFPDVGNMVSGNDINVPTTNVQENKTQIRETTPITNQTKNVEQDQNLKYGKNGNSTLKKWAQNERFMVNLNDKNDPETKAFISLFGKFYKHGLLKAQGLETPRDILKIQKNLTNEELQFQPFIHDEFIRAGIKDAEANIKKQENKTQKNTNETAITSKEQNTQQENRATESKQSNQPIANWLQETIERNNGIAEKLGLADEIENLSAQRLTKKEIVARIRDRVPSTYDRSDLVEIVAAVKSKRDIPSMDDTAEFNKWIENRSKSIQQPNTQESTNNKQQDDDLQMKIAKITRSQRVADKIIEASKTKFPDSWYTEQSIAKVQTVKGIIFDIVVDNRTDYSINEYQDKTEQIFEILKQDNLEQTQTNEDRTAANNQETTRPTQTKPDTKLDVLVDKVAELVDAIKENTNIVKAREDTQNDNVDENSRGRNEGVKTRPTQEANNVRGADTIPGDAGRTSDGSMGDNNQQPETKSSRGSKENGSDAAGVAYTGDSERIRNERTYDVSEHRGGNYRITPEDVLFEGGKKTRFKNNIAAIKLVKELEKEGRRATPEEQKILIKFVGWGGLKEAFNNKVIYEDGKPKFVSADPKWEKEYNELKELLTKSEYDAAIRSSSNAFYTRPELISTMYDMARHLGFNGGKILEPSSGIGHFVGMLPEDMANKSSAFAVEKDNISGLIAKYLYPDSKVRINGFEEVSIPNNYFDLAISNVPFGDLQIRDNNYSWMDYSSSTIHNYFFIKSLDKVKEGGLVIFITSTGTMDTSIEQFRTHISDRADLVAAFRLPSNTFKENAGTEVTTDLIILRKRVKGELPSGVNFTRNAETKIKLANGNYGTVNEYFIKNPENVLGKYVVDKLTGNRIGVESNGDAMLKLREAINKLPKNIYTIEKSPVQELTLEEEAKAIKEGKENSYVTKDGQLYQIKDGKKVKVTAKENKNAEKIKSLAELKSIVNELIALQYSTKEEVDLSKLQSKLNKTYDDFVKKHGFVANNLKYIKDDPEISRLQGLELEVEAKEGDPKAKPQYVKADIFSKRVVVPYIRATSAKNATEALAIVMYEDGFINLPRIAQLIGKSENQAIADLRGKIFNNPQAGWELESEYLSGNVKEKLIRAREAAEIDSSYQDNVTALEAVQPTIKPYGKFRVSFGSGWIPAQEMKTILSDILNTRNIEISYSELSGKWNVRVNSSNVEISNLELGNLDASKLITKALNKDKIEIRYTDRDGKSHADIEQTNLAKAKARELEQKFFNYLNEDFNMQKRFEELYNDKINIYVERTFKKQDKKYIGMSNEINLRPHQVQAVERTVYGGNVLLAHDVGFGKTFIMLTAVMELKRLGIAKKPLIIMPNNKLTDFRNDMIKLYPQAKILAAEADDFKPENIKALLARIATNDWDCVMIRHSSFEKIPVSPALEEAYIEEEIMNLRVVLTEAKQRGEKKFTAEQIQKRIDDLEFKLAQSRSRPRYDVFPFEEMGIDYLFVDEAHHYKNLAFATTKGDVKGVNSKGANKTDDFYIKTKYITSLHGGKKGLVFATGTPVTNALNEVFTTFKYLRPDILESTGTQSFDGWVSNFGLIESKPEVKTGGVMAYVERFRNFYNLEELFKMFKEFADMKYDPKEAGLKLPDLKNGKPTIVECETHPDYDNFVNNVILRRIERMPKGKAAREKGADNALAIGTTARQATADMRLVSPDAKDFEGSKVSKTVSNVLDVYNKTNDYKGTQLIFFDRSTSDIFDASIDIYQKLVKAGIPKDEIAFANKFNSEAKQQKLFADMNSGKVRILIGTYAKMGTGLNVQERLAALHEVDTPDRPADILQAEGRMIRQGNKHAEWGKDVEIFRYVISGRTSYDAVRWQMIETKMKAINKLMKGENILEIEADEDAADSAEREIMIIKAKALGDERVIRQIELQEKLPELESERTNYYATNNKYKRVLQEFPERKVKTQEALDLVNKDIDEYAKYPKDVMEFNIDGKVYKQTKGDKYKKDEDSPKKLAGQAIQNAVERSYLKQGETIIATYKGFTLYGKFERSNIYIRNNYKYNDYSQSILINELKTPEGVIDRIEKEINDVIYAEQKSLEARIIEIQKNIDVARAKVTDKPFPKEAEYQEMRAEKDLIDVELENNVPLEESKTKYKKVQKVETPVPEVKGSVDSMGLANNPEDLKSQIENMRMKFRLMDIDLQLFAAAKKKYKRISVVSLLYRNTLKNINNYTEEQRAEFAQADGRYDRRSEEESLDAAQRRLANDFDGEVERLPNKEAWTGIDVDVAYGILEVYRDEGDQTGDYSKMKAWARVIRRRGATEAGRAVQAHAKYSRDINSIIFEAESLVEDAENAMLEKNKEVIDSVDGETALISNIVEAAEKQAEADVVKAIAQEQNEAQAEDSNMTEEEVEAEEISNAQKLARKIINTTRGRLKPKEKEIVDALIDEMYAKFRQTLPKPDPKNKIAELASAVENRQITGEMWAESKEIVRKKFESKKMLQNYPDAGAFLDEYFKTGTRPPFAQKTLNAAIKQAMKKLNFKLSEIVKNYYKQGKKQRGELVDYIVQESGLSGKDAEILSKYVQNKIKAMKKEYSEKYLNMLFKPRPTNPTEKEQKNIEFIESLANTGAFLNDNYNFRVLEKLEPRLKTLIRLSGIKMNQLVRKNKKFVEFNRKKFVEDLMAKIEVNKFDAERIASAANVVFDQMAKEERKKILDGMKRNTTVKKRKTMFDRVMELINLDAYSDLAMRDIIKEKYNLPVLSNEDIKNIIEYAEIKQTLEPGSYLDRLVHSKIEQIMSSKVPVTLREKFRGLQRIWLLLNPKTWIRNIGGNVILNAGENVKDVPGAWIDYLTSRALGTERTTLFAPIKKLKWQFVGASKGIQEQYMDVKYGVDTSYMNERYEVRKGRIYKSEFFNNLDQTLKTILKFGDRPYFEAAYNMRVNELMMIRNTTEVTPDIDAAAKLYALERVFQNDSVLAEKAKKLRELLGPVGDIAMPFVQTPANIFDKLIDYTPAGMAKALYELGKTSNNRRIRSVIEGEFNQKVFVDRLSRSLTGSGLAMLGAALAYLGLVTGGDNDDREKVRSFLRNYRQKYSFLIGDKWYSFDWAQPLSGALAAGVDAYYASKNKKDLLESLSAGMNAAGDSLIQQSLFRGILNILSDFSIWGTVVKTVENGSQQTNPTVIKQIAATVDPYARETYSPSAIKEFANRLIANIPFLSKTLPAKVDSFGNKIERYDGANTVLNVMFNPGNVKDFKPTKVQQEMYDLFNATDNTDVLPSVVEETLKMSVQGRQFVMPLDPKQFVMYQTLAGKLTQGIATEIIDAPGYKNLTTEQKAKLLGSAVSKAKAVSRDYMIKKYIDDKVKERASK